MKNFYKFSGVGKTLTNDVKIFWFELLEINGGGKIIFMDIEN